MTKSLTIEPSRQLKDVRYEIRGRLARRAQEMERQGYEILSLNIGNPGLFGFRTPETMRLAMIENLSGSEAYCHQKGIFPAREAVVMQHQDRGIMDITAEQVFIGNGVSELIDLTLRALLNPGDEVLIPTPDYPLWTAAATLNGGRAIYYPCPEETDFIPDPEAVEALITPNTRAIVVINPNNPTGAVYSRDCLTQLAELADRHDLVMLSDEIYDQMVFPDAEFVPMATLCSSALCATFSGLSKVYRACGYRVGWVAFSGAQERSGRLIDAMDLLAALRLCSNVPGQWAVQTALGGYQSIKKLCSPGGRLYESRQAVIDAVAKSPYLHVIAPMGSMYAFIGVNTEALPDFDDESFALELLQEQHVLVAPGSSFNTPYRDHFRITILPDEETLAEVFERMDEVLRHMASRPAKLESA
ncbi:MAG: aminotransferase class I/II-fold pyridoxal phosphate-dependent enzyme [Gammaproteobacteria bacterium]|nr:aminotransferase class I/II-fold pyridoxal phosphate-dependent enzyme [Gammaproteobacteria bacterium]MCZ6584901.1 aminotransferase class I/II-fold pyridoxal phosphate-dependent enzyme [Gammaproteobacteria bacterium]